MTGDRHGWGLVGRKFTFLLTISIMGGATALVGLLPTYSAIGLLAPILLVLIRLLQGLALGAFLGVFGFVRVILGGEATSMAIVVGVTLLAVVVTGTVVGALSASGPAYRFDRPRMEETEADIRNAALKISQRMGWLGAPA